MLLEMSPKMLMPSQYPQQSDVNARLVMGVKESCRKICKEDIKLLCHDTHEAKKNALMNPFYMKTIQSKKLLLPQCVFLARDGFENLISEKIVC